MLGDDDLTHISCDSLRGYRGRAMSAEVSARNLPGSVPLAEAGVGSQILVVDDDHILRDTIARHLRMQGFQAHEAPSCRIGRDMLARHAIDVVLVDVQLPDGSGFDLAREIRRAGRTDVIFVTQRDSEADIVLGFGLGAEDYVAKPVKLPELSARIRRLTSRRAREWQLQEAMTGRLSISGWAMDSLRRELTAPDGTVLRLTVAEYAVFYALVVARGCVVGRPDLLESVIHRQDVASDRTIDVLVARIRGKLKQAGAGHPRIITASGRGYRVAFA